MINTIKTGNKCVLVLDTKSVNEILKKKDFSGIFAALKCCDEEQRSMPLFNATLGCSGPIQDDSLNSPETAISPNVNLVVDPVVSLDNFSVSLDEANK